MGNLADTQGMVYGEVKAKILGLEGHKQRVSEQITVGSGSR